MTALKALMTTLRRLLTRLRLAVSAVTGPAVTAARVAGDRLDRGAARYIAAPIDRFAITPLERVINRVLDMNAWATLVHVATWRPVIHRAGKREAASSPLAEAVGAVEAEVAAMAEEARVTLYRHMPHPHTPRNANARAQAAIAARHSSVLGRVNIAVAVWLTKHTGTMTCAYIFAGIGMGSLAGIITGNVFLASICGSLSSYFLQLVLLPILSVGQNVLAEHAEAQSDEQFHATMRTLHGEEQVTRHLDAQDTELLRHGGVLERIEAGLTALLAAQGITTTPAPVTPATEAATEAAAPAVTEATPAPVKRRVGRPRRQALALPN